MGDTGPCGPCSEIFYDHGDDIPGGPPGSPDEDGDRFIEIWNLVFMQFEQVTKEERIDLPRPSIDTGMGLERIAAVLQGVHDNYDIDLFRALIRASEEATGVKAEGKNRASHRVIADHLRASSFLIADGVLPSNEGRGYVLRRIMRRAMRHAQLLGAADPLMWRLVPALVREMGQAYPELVRGEPLITETLKLEETRFRKTLARGLEPARPRRPTTLSSGDRLRRRDRVQALRHLRLPARPDAGCAAPARHRGRHRRLQRGDGAAEGRGARQLGRLRRGGDRERSGSPCATRPAPPSSWATTPRRPKASSPRWSATARSSTRPSEGETVGVVVNQTPFYGESGGQMGDTGTISGEGFRIEVTDTQKKGDGLFVHEGKVAKGTVKTGAAVELAVDHARRTRLRSNHSATHLVHEALREVLGTHVAQKGSLVAPERLRFDFSHPKPISPDELEKVEKMANEIVVQNSPVTTRLMTVDDAIAEGAMALFGEKYGDEVRVVSMGTATAATSQASPIRSSCAAARMSTPPATSASCRLVGESAVAAGVRRIEALTGEAARRHLDEQDKRLKAVAATLKVAAADVPARVEALLDERRKLERELTEAKKKLALGGGAPASARQRGRDGRRRRLHRPHGERRLAEGSEAAGRRGQEEPRLRRRRLRRRRRRRQGERRGRRHRRPHQALQRGRSGARGVGRARRAGRRRPARHGAGRRPRRDQGRRGDRRGEGRDAGGLRFGCVLSSLHSHLRSTGCRQSSRRAHRRRPIAGAATCRHPDRRRESKDSHGRAIVRAPLDRATSVD